MKKIFKFLFLIILVFALYACSPKEEEKPIDLDNMTAEEEANYYGLEGIYHRVTFKNEDEVVMVALFKEGTNDLYVKGEKVDLPTIAEREGYDGNWSMTSFSSVKRDFENTYKWEIKTYKIYFINDGETVKSTTVDYGTVITEADLPELEVPYGYTSLEWDITLPYTVKATKMVYTTSESIVFSETENTAFNDYLDELFYEVLGTDPLSINFDLYDAASFNKEGVFKYEDCFFDGYDFSIEGDLEAYNEMAEIIKKLKSFEDTSLTKEQYLDKIVMLDYYEKNYAYKDYFYYGTLLGSYLGYQAQLPSTLAEYHFYDKKCIDDYLSYVNGTKAIFEGIVGFENAKYEEGMPLTDTIINRVIEQCDNFINADSENPCFLLQAFDDKVKECTFLTQQEITDYIALNKKAVNDNFIPAYSYLKEELEKMLGREYEISEKTGEEYVGSFAQMEKGKEYYTAKIQDALGTTMTVDEIYAYVGKKLGQCMSTYSYHYDKIMEFNAKNLMNENSLNLEDVIPYLMEALKEDFPELQVKLDYQIQNVPEALRENSSPAYYFISPFDANTKESIYINPENDDLKFPSTYLLTVLAHEGYPGHMYQNVYMKNCDNISNVRKLISYTSYAEAWTIHIENYIMKYFSDDEDISSIMLAYNSLSYLIIGMVDMGVNYYGWDKAKAKEYLSNYFNLDNEEFEEIYYDVTEIPTNYLMYYYSAFRLEDMKTMFKKLMGDDYSDKLFHQLYLSCGSTSFEIVEYYLRDYANTYKASK